MSETIVDYSTSDKLNKLAEVEECAICWEQMTDTEAVTLYYSASKVACSHKFHNQCIQCLPQPWKCPLCRARFYQVSVEPLEVPTQNSYERLQQELQQLRRSTQWTSVLAPTQLSSSRVSDVVADISNRISRQTNNLRPTATLPRTQTEAVPNVVQQPGILHLVEQGVANPNNAEIASRRFTVEELRTTFPVGIDPSRKEEYLDDATFSEVFGMNKNSFAALASWRRISLKKKLGFF